MLGKVMRRSSHRDAAANFAEGALVQTAIPIGDEARAGWAKTFAALQHPRFRWYWMGMLAYFLAMNMGGIARGWLAYDLTGKATALGLVSLSWGAPMVVFSLLGGAIADRSDKRAITLVSQVALFGLAICAAVLVHTGVIRVWHLAALAFAEGTILSFAIPARMAWIPELIDERNLMNGIALNNAAMQTTRIVGPGMAGGLIALPFFGMTGTFYLIAACYVLVFWFMFQIPSSRGSHSDVKLSLATRMLEGVRYIARHDLLLLLLILALLLVMLGAPFQIMLPVFAGEKVYDVGSVGLGIMATSAGIGATIGALAVGFWGDSFKQGKVQFAAGLGFGVGLALFGAIDSFLLALPILALLGMTSASYLIINNTLVLTYAERRFHGRVMSVYLLTWSIMPVVAMPIAALADIVGVQRTVLGLGLTLLLLLAGIRLFHPGLRHLDNLPPPSSTE